MLGNAGVRFASHCHDQYGVTSPIPPTKETPLIETFRNPRPFTTSNVETKTTTN